MSAGLSQDLGSLGGWSQSQTQQGASQSQSFFSQPDNQYNVCFTYFFHLIEKDHQRKEHIHSAFEESIFCADRFMHLVLSLVHYHQFFVLCRD